MVRRHALEDVAFEDVHIPPLPVALPDKERQRKSRVSRKRSGPPEDRRMIAWDGEGIKLSGDGAPQHYVLFGCSARVDDPLKISDPTKSLEFRELADYMLETAAMFPRAFHVGYAFKYDQNMIIRSLRWSNKRELQEKGETRVRYPGGVTYKVSWVPGKKIEILRLTSGRKTSSHIKIEDIFAFFASSFVSAYTATFPDADSDPNWQRVVEGKKQRATTKWEDMPEIELYWRHEIIALERLAEGFKDMLWSNEFYLMQWYGPGAFANYIRRTRNLVEHEWGGKEENLEPKIHEAIKSAYYGGHFEQYKAGRIKGPIYAYDINSAYPAAFCALPSLAEGGFWQRVPYLQLDKEAANPSSPLTVFHISWQYTGGRVLQVHEPMPFPYRDERGNVSYDVQHSGWYWSPEVTAAVNSKRWGQHKIRIKDAYRWIPVVDIKPWADVIEPMYQTRLALKKAKNPAQMVFKLGPNSLYGKMAQRVGFDEETLKPPKAHTLCIAGYLTSWCRAMILRMMDTMTTDQIIAVETDGIYSTCPPEQVEHEWPDVRFSEALGEWGMDVYDEIVYIQNGVYICRVGEEWKTKTRGINAALLPPDKVLGYVETCLPGEIWEPLKIDGGEQFLGLGTAMHRSITPEGKLIASKANRLHCVWYPDEKIVDPAGSMKSKRIHHRNCPACRAGLSMAEGAHELYVHLRFSYGKGRMSAPYRLPWETRKVEQWREAMRDTDTLPEHRRSESESR